MRTPYSVIRHFRDRMRLDEKSYRVYTILRIAVIATAVRCAMQRNYESLALCILSLLLFLLPAFFEERFLVEIPTGFHIVIYLFIFAAEILGEVNHYYTAIPGWDTMLHTLNGFLCAAIGFSIVYLLNRHSKTLYLTPFTLALVAFCFSMTIGVMWEFLEFFFDTFFYLDMQKDFLVTTISSVRLDPTNSQIPERISHITRTIVETAAGGQYVILGGYLDIGIGDTMKDLLVNFLGAIVFSTIGYIYARSSEKNENSLARRLMVRTISEEELAEQQVVIEQRRRARKRVRVRKKKI